MPGERLVFDPRTEAAANAPLELVEVDGGDVRGVTLLEHDYPAPEPQSLMASSADTEGDPLIQNRYGNRQIPVRLRVVEPADAAATNLVADPSFETASGLWAGVGGGLLARSSAAAREGDTGALITVPAAAGTGIASPAGAAAWPCSASTTYTAAAYVRAAAASDVGKTVQLLVEEITNAGATVGGTTATVVLTAQWQRLSVSRAFGATGVRFRLWLANTTATAFNFHADQVQMIAEASASNYFDGDTPGCSWTGTYGASTSTRPAPGGPRFYAIVADLEKKIDRINREGGTLKRVVPDGSPIVFDLLSATWHPTSDRRFIFAKRTEAEVTFTAKAFGRGATEIVGADNDESTLPCLRFLTTGVQGNVPALGRLIVTERQAVDQFRWVWGLRSRYYDAGANAALFYEAEGRTLPSGSASTADAGASGGNMVRRTATPFAYTTIITTQATGGGAHLSHTGVYRVMARVRSQDAMDWTFDYAEADLLRPTVTGKVHRTSANDWELADLGVVRLTKGRWQGRVLVRSTSGNATGYNADLDCLFLVPIAEGAGEATAGPITTAPTSYSALAATTLQSGGGLYVGGNFTGGGDADDFGSDGTRAAVSDTGTIIHGGGGRMNWVNGLSMTNTLVQVDFKTTALANALRMGVAARVASATSGVMVVYSQGSTEGTIRLTVSGGPGDTSIQVPSIVANAWYTISVYVDARGRVYVWMNAQGATLGDPVITRTVTSLATGGGLQSGSVGVVDSNTAATACTRSYANFRAWAPSLDAALFASRQAEVLSSLVRRQDSTGANPGAVGYEGDYLLIPPAGPENRTTEIIVKATRSLVADDGIDDIRAALAYTPRYLAVPG